MSQDDASQRIEECLRQALARPCGSAAPPRIAMAMQHAVFPGGQRIRPRLALSIAAACGDDKPVLSGAAAAAIELLHCASLVHDDMPCFDNAAIRRGKPSVHAAFGEQLALLAGDGLIVLAFETVALAAIADPMRSAAIAVVVARAVGMPHGIVAGQAWESEPAPDLVAYQRAKTGSLFAGASMAGAAALGFCLGEAYQVADDIRDVLCTEAEIGKPIGQDEALGRPNMVHELGVAGAARRLKDLVEQAAASVPDCAGQAALRAQIRAQSSRFLPREAARVAA